METIPWPFTELPLRSSVRREKEEGWVMLMGRTLALMSRSAAIPNRRTRRGKRELPPTLAISGSYLYITKGLNECSSQDPHHPEANREHCRALPRDLWCPDEKEIFPIWYERQNFSTHITETMKIMKWKERKERLGDIGMKTQNPCEGNSSPFFFAVLFKMLSWSSSYLHIWDEVWTRKGGYHLNIVSWSNAALCRCKAPLDGTFHHHIITLVMTLTLVCGDLRR